MLESLVYVRHGQSVENMLYHLVEEGVIYSREFPPIWAKMRGDLYPLTTLGRLQAKVAGSWMSGNIGGYDVCYCSPFVRAVQTAKLVVPEVDCIYDECLGEISMQDQGAAHRVWSWLDIIVQRHAGQRVLVIGHGYWSLRLRQRLQGWSEEYIRGLGWSLAGLRNCSILHYEFAQKRFRLVWPYDLSVASGDWQQIGDTYGGK